MSAFRCIAVAAIIGLIAAHTRAEDVPGDARGDAPGDAIDRMLRQGQVPADMRNRHGYSDFTDPLGRFLDLLAAGAFVEARAIQPDACASWLATRNSSAFSGKVWIWNTQINLDTLCKRS